MGQDGDLVVKWIRTGGVCGLLGVGAYVAAAFAPLPDVLGYAAAFAFGPLVAIGAIGLYYCLSLERRDPLAQICRLLRSRGRRRPSSSC